MMVLTIKIEQKFVGHGIFNQGPLVGDDILELHQLGSHSEIFG